MSRAPEVVGRSSPVKGGNATCPQDTGMESRLVGRAGRGNDRGGEYAYVSCQANVQHMLHTQFSWLWDKPMVLDH